MYQLLKQFINNTLSEFARLDISFAFLDIDLNLAVT